MYSSGKSHISSDSCLDTVDVIRELCKEKTPIDICNRVRDNKCVIRDDDYRDQCKPNRFDPGVSYFTSVITPVVGLTPQYSGCSGSVEFKMRRKNKTVTLQWEPFSGSMASSGVAFLTVAQSICNTPPYPIYIPISLEYKGIHRVTNITIDPHSNNGNIKFYLNSDGSTSNINAGDSFYVFGGAITWIVD